MTGEPEAADGPTAEGDLLYDYCHYPYRPSAPTAGRWRSRRLLEQSFEHMRCDGGFVQLVDTLRDAVGRDATIWGVKHVGGGELQWEFYFYNYGRQDPRVTPARVLEAIAPLLRSDGLEVCERFRYFMFSMDVMPAALQTGRLDGLHLYVYDVEDRQTALSYFVDARGARLENHYAFYRPGTEWRALAAKVTHSAVVDFSAMPLEAILLPELVDCHSICIANKQDCDAVYFSRVDFDQFLFFLRRFHYPSDLVQSIERQRSRLDHLRYDVGFDYRSRGAELVVKKSGYYGTF